MVAGEVFGNHECQALSSQNAPEHNEVFFDRQNGVVFFQIGRYILHKAGGTIFPVAPIDKELCRAMFCLLVVLIYLCVLVCKKGYLIARKGYCTSAKVFLVFHLKRGYPKSCQWEKTIITQIKKCQIELLLGASSLMMF